jgi:hypothetical protein
VQKCCDDRFFIEAMRGGEIENIDAAKVAIRCIADQPFDCGGRLGVGGLPQDAEKGFGFAHRWSV